LSLLAYITTCGASVGLFIGLLTIYEKLVKPNLKKTKLRIAVSLINDWFDYIDCNLEKGIDFPVLDNKEKKVANYIESNLKGYEIKLNKKIRRAWLKKQGIKKTLLDSEELFTNYSRMSCDGYDLFMFFYLIAGNFLSFHVDYKSDNPKGCNFATVEMPVKFLNFLVK
jgi:hypothetical protein